MAACEAFLEQCGRTKRLLGQLRDKKVKKLVSDNEAATIRGLLQTTTLSESEAPSAVKALQAAGLGEDHTADLLWTLGQKIAEGGKAQPQVSAPAAPRAGAAPAAPRAGDASTGQPQNYESCVHFFPASVWESTKTSRSVEPMVNFCLTLGLRKPSPYTCQVLSCASQLHYKGVEACTAMDQVARTQEVHLVAKMVKRKAGALPPPSEWLRTLPETPVDFASKYRELFSAVYGSDPAHHPVQAVISLMDFEMLRSETRCRHQKGGAAAKAPAQLIVGPLPPGLEQFGCSMLKQMQALTSEVQSLKGGGGAGGRSPAGRLRLDSVRAAIADQTAQGENVTARAAIADKNAQGQKTLGDSPAGWEIEL